MNVKELISSRDSLSVLYTDFSHLKHSNPLSFFTFYEGKDAPYYYSKIHSTVDMEITPIKCKGKSMVKRLFKSLDQKGELTGIKTGFFIDRDFDRNDEDYVVANFYVTDRYSIENYYVSEACLVRIIKNELGITEEKDDFNIIISRFRSFQQTYHQSTSLFNAWYSTIKNSDKTCTVSLQEKLPDGFLVYDFNNWTVGKQYTLDNLNSRYSHLSYVVTEDEIASVQAELDSNPTFSYRGKFEMTCLIEFMKKIQSELNRKKHEEGELSVNPYRSQISMTNCISLWAQYTDSDEAKLKDYITRRTQ